MNEKEFELLVGCKPELDDLDRANCKDAGQPGHLQCGLCSKCGKPKFVCMCQSDHDNSSIENKVIDSCVDTIEHLLDYNRQTSWGRSLRYAVEELKKKKNNGKTNLELACAYFNQQGGTIHQISSKTGISITELLSSKDIITLIKKQEKN